MVGSPPLGGDGVRDADFIQSLERGLSVIRAFEAEHPKLSLSEVAVRTGLSRAAARRFLHTLVDLGYMRADGSQFSLRPPLTPHTTADPAALRAELARIRSQGWAMVDQELEEGLRSVAAPIRDGEGRAIAAVNVSTHAGRRSLAGVIDDLLEPLLRTAREIEADLHRSAAPSGARRAP